MRRHLHVAAVTTFIIVQLFGYLPAAAEKGFSIEGGLMYDKPTGETDNQTFDDLQPGMGYAANLGYDFVERLGLELGVVRTYHDYDILNDGGLIREESASQTKFYLKIRGIPFKAGKSEVVLAVGPGLFDLSGRRIIGVNEVDAVYSGWGVLSSACYRYHINSGLAVSANFALNFVHYDNYQVTGYNTDSVGDLPKGNSVAWGLTLFHRIGIPQF